ncbi:hypothetical protein CVT25_000793 [Psilocybe cyanescens]|uniref:Uncharacterized protein n=1 Tax=Psilocybe cyanescens TaxID=93625 RepID=A0A409XM54_PSICY|nr:hypothetical protein CVT25_000793 [Psilocybe cyanescens]
MSVCIVFVLMEIDNSGESKVTLELHGKVQSTHHQDEKLHDGIDQNEENTIQTLNSVPPTKS